MATTLPHSLLLQNADGFLELLGAHHSDPGWFPAGYQTCTEEGKEYEAIRKRQNDVNLISLI